MNYSSVQYFELLKEVIINTFVKNYPYYYLNYCYKCNKSYGGKMIITGSSYAKNGIIVGELEGGYNENINFSVDSQDLYYDFCHLKKVIAEGKRKPGICIINSGYYMLYQDLSLSTEEGRAINSIYEPIFHDLHHWKVHDDAWTPLKNVEFDRDIFSEDILLPLCEEWSLGVLYEQKEYYNSVAGFRYKVFKKGDVDYVWNQLNEEEKDAIAYERAKDHNRLFKHRHSRSENGDIIHDMVEYCIKNDIRPVFIIFPFSKYYNKYIRTEYREDIYECLNKLPFPVDFLDINDSVWSDMFSDEDFVDGDHLNDIGAHKATMVLNEFLRMI